jgi:hypothetical protein
VPAAPLVGGAVGRARKGIVALVVAAVVASVAGPASARLLGPGQSASFKITYYWFVPESRFVGQAVAAPGLSGTYREDFLYSANGVPMEGTGTDLAGSAIHYAGGSGGYWVNVSGARTDPGRNGWSHGAPYWRDGGWRNASGGVTFKHADGTWDNGPGVGKKRPYSDSFGTGPGVPVTPWHSIATDTSVLPRGTSVYVPSLATTPAHGCFRAEDTGGAIIGNHIDVLVPASASLGTLPEQGLLTALAPGQACPPGVPTDRDLGVVRLRYTWAAREWRFTAVRIAALGSGVRAREDFLYGSRGVVRRGFGALASGRELVFAGGGFWVNARGRRTDPTLSGGWTHGQPFWRDGGWRNAQGAPTWRRKNGTWTRGRGVRKLRYHDRFRIAQPGERIGWHAVGAPSSLAPAGTRLKLAAFPSVGCFVAEYAAGRGVGTRGLEVVVPLGTDLATLPSTTRAEAIATTSSVGACAS